MAFELILDLILTVFLILFLLVEILVVKKIWNWVKKRLGFTVKVFETQEIKVKKSEKVKKK